TAVTPTAVALTPTPPAPVRATVKAWEPSKEIPALINMLVNDDPLVQMEARQELLLTGRKTVVPFLLQSLENAKPELRYMIVEILAELRDEQSVPVLVKLLSDKDEHTTSVASVAARALGKIAEPSAISALLKTAVATDVELRYETIQALGLVLRGQDITTTQTAIPYIKAALTDTAKTFQGYLLKAAAVQSLGSAGSRIPRPLKT
ncbi:MAG: HEAT repeat domain-containing protein, partial [Planctomycetes bacterium]|nr:HEAT repeat domain-containing protein [Planctomycetota bacterium]